MTDVLREITHPDSPVTALGVLALLHARCDFWLHLGPRGPFEARFFLGSHAELVCDKAGLWWMLGDGDPITNMGQLARRLADLGYPSKS